MKKKLQCTIVGNQKYHIMPHLFGMVRKLSVPRKRVCHETKACPFKHKIFSTFTFLSLEEFLKYFYFNFLLWKILNIYKSILRVPMHPSPRFNNYSQLFLFHLLYTPFPSLIYYFEVSPRNYILLYTNILISLKGKIILKT